MTGVGGTHHMKEVERMTNEELIQSIQDHIDSGVGEYEGYGLTLDER